MAPASSLKFGTSGLRGLVTDLCGPPAYAYTLAFIDMLVVDNALDAHNREVFIGRDYRSSSPAINNLVAQAIADRGFVPVDCGALPTPALALAAMGAQAPSIMVTGSHIPDDRNGLKFYRAAGEIDKSDEVRIVAQHRDNAVTDVPTSTFAMELPKRNPIMHYQNRYLAFFPADCLKGKRIGVYQHSSVARDIIATTITALGAECIALGRSEQFIPVDTEAVRDEDKALARQWAAEFNLDAIVSTDGDADRPLIADEQGQFLRGDLVGAITARLLGVTTLVTPVTSNSQLEKSFRRVTRTKVGSPFVIAAVEAQRAAGHGPVIGFEANGGLLLGDDVSHDGRVLPRLLTRDSLLPILATLVSIAAHNKSLSAIAAQFAFAHADSTRIEHVPPEKSGPFLTRLQGDESAQRDFFAEVGGVASLDATDGLRFTLNNGDTVHFRASGNAPELRVYVEALTAERCSERLSWAFTAARQHGQF